MLVSALTNNNDNGLLRKIQALGELAGNNGYIRYSTLILFIFISITECLPMLLMIVQRSGFLRDAAGSYATT